MILVSSCLAGFKCAYDGNDKTLDLIVNLVKEGKAIPVCPEQLGGLTTPRYPAEIQYDNDEEVIDTEGNNVTEAFFKGASQTLELCKMYNCDTVILKQNSPSCGVNSYDGSFTSKVVNKPGVTAKLLMKHGIKVIASDDEEAILAAIEK